MIKGLVDKMAEKAGSSESQARVTNHHALLLAILVRQPGLPSNFDQRSSMCIIQQIANLAGDFLKS